LNNNTNKRQALWVGIGSLSSFTMAIVSAVILSRFLDKESYGTYRQVLYVYSTLLVVFSAGLPNVFSYFLPRFSLNEGKYIVWKITKILFLTGFLFSLILYYLADFLSIILNNLELSPVLKLFSPIPLLMLPALGIEGVFATYKKAKFIAFYNIITRVIVLLGIVLPVIFYQRSVYSALYGWFFAALISLIIALFFKKIPFKGIKNKKAKITYKEILLYSIPIAIASFWGVVIKSADQFYISRFFGTEAFAVFSNGFIELPFVSMVTLAASTVLMPLFSKMIHNKARTEDVINLWKSAILKSAIIIYPIVIFFIINATSVVVLLYSENYVESVLFFRIAMFINFFNVILFAPLIFAFGKTKYYSNVHMVFAILTWLFGYLVILIFDSPIGIALLSVFLRILKVIVFLHFSSKILKVNIRFFFPIKKILLIITHSSVIGFFVSLLSDFLLGNLNLFFNLLFNCAVYFTVLIFTGNMIKVNYIGLIASFVKGKDENQDKVF